MDMIGRLDRGHEVIRVPFTNRTIVSMQAEEILVVEAQLEAAVIIAMKRLPTISNIMQIGVVVDVIVAVDAGIHRRHVVEGAAATAEINRADIAVAMDRLQPFQTIVHRPRAMAQMLTR